MELQQLSDMNSGGVKSNGSAKSAMTDTRNHQQASTETSDSSEFEDQLNQQVDQMRSSSNTEKNQENQASKENSQNTQATLSESTENTETSDAAPVTETPEVDEDVVEHINIPGYESTSEAATPEATLPLTGNNLPPQQAAQAAVASTTQATPEQNSHSQPVQDTRPQQPAVTQKQLAENVATAPSTAAAAAQNTTVEKLAGRLNGVSEKVQLQNQINASTLENLQTAEMLNQASRLKQVPLSNMVTQSLQTTNSHANAAADVNGFIAAQNNPFTTSMSTSISANIQTPAWSNQMTEQVAYMLKGGVQQAEIKLNPAHLGPMQVKLVVSDDQASINFVTQHAPVRDAVDAALPRLREMLEEQGINLADVDVSTHSEQHSGDFAEQQSGQSSGTSVADHDEVNGATSGEDINIQKLESVNTGLSIFA